MYFLSCLESHTANLYEKTGAKRESRIIDFQSMKAQKENIESEVTKISQILRALPGLHVFASCDTVSVFSGKLQRKNKGL